jgi:tetratricopeptide (TPR) repeat protein
MSLPFVREDVLYPHRVKGGPRMERDDLLERYEAFADERDFAAARRQYEQALARSADAATVLEYGYLLECHGRNSIRLAAAQYERALELDPGAAKARYQLIGARTALLEVNDVVEIHRHRHAAAPGDVAECRFLACALVAARRWEEARDAIAAGLALSPDDAALTAFRGQVREEQGDPAGARADWRRALELDPEDMGRSTAAPSSSSGREGRRTPRASGARSRSATRHPADRSSRTGPAVSSTGSAPTMTSVASLRIRGGSGMFRMHSPGRVVQDRGQELSPRARGSIRPRCDRPLDPRAHRAMSFRA